MPGWRPAVPCAHIKHQLGRTPPMHTLSGGVAARPHFLMTAGCPCHKRAARPTSGWGRHVWQRRAAVVAWPICLCACRWLCPVPLPPSWCIPIAAARAHLPSSLANALLFAFSLHRCLHALQTDSADVTPTDATATTSTTDPTAAAATRTTGNTTTSSSSDIPSINLQQPFVVTAYHNGLAPGWRDVSYGCIECNMMDTERVGGWVGWLCMWVCRVAAAAPLAPPRCQI